MAQSVGWTYRDGPEPDVKDQEIEHKARMATVGINLVVDHSVVVGASVGCVNKLAQRPYGTHSDNCCGPKDRCDR